jgi:hypothetical protein
MTVHSIFKDPYVHTLQGFCDLIEYAVANSLNIQRILECPNMRLWWLSIEAEVREFRRVNAGFFEHQVAETIAQTIIPAFTGEVHVAPEEHQERWGRRRRAMDYEPNALPARGIVPVADDVLDVPLSSCDPASFIAMLAHLDDYTSATQPAKVTVVPPVNPVLPVEELISDNPIGNFVDALIDLLAHSPSYYKLCLHVPTRTMSVPNAMHIAMRHAYLDELRAYKERPNAATGRGCVSYDVFPGQLYEDINLIEDQPLTTHPFMARAKVSRKSLTMHPYIGATDTGIQSHIKEGLQRFSCGLLKDFEYVRSVSVQDNELRFMSAVTGSAIAACAIRNPRLFADKKRFEGADLDIAIEVPCGGVPHDRSMETALEIFDALAAAHFAIMKKSQPRLRLERVATENKHKWAVVGGKIACEMYHVQDLPFTIRKFHLGQVRAWWGVRDVDDEEPSLHVYPSFLMAAFTRLSPDVRWTSCNVDIRNVILKYLYRGFGVVLMAADSLNLRQYAKSLEWPALTRHRSTGVNFHFFAQLCQIHVSQNAYRSFISMKGVKQVVF